MKIFFLLLMTASVSFGQKPFGISKTELAAKFDTHAKQKTESIDSYAEKYFATLAQVKLEGQDLLLIQNAILVLVKLDKEDPSRTSVQILAESYSKNLALYKKAFKTIATSENKNVLQEIEDLMKSFSQAGNG